MRKQFTDRRIVKIYLDEPDWKWVEMHSDGNMSRWCREQVLEGRSDNHRAVVLQSGGEVRRVKGRKPDAAGSVEDGPIRSGKFCAHGIEKGWRCWQCGGPAKVVG